MSTWGGVARNAIRGTSCMNCCTLLDFGTSVSQLWSPSPSFTFTFAYPLHTHILCSSPLTTKIYIDSRPDRDDHVIISYSNIKSSAYANFEKASTAAVNSLGSPYDFTSLMHYPSVSFSTDGQPTIIPVGGFENFEPWETMGQRAKLSGHDVEQLRLLYQCSSGARGGDVGVNELCSTDCPCWEHAIGECTSDDECMGDLVCGVTPDPLPTVEYVDVLPYYTETTGSFSCNDYCHVNCCGYANSIMRCPETCNSAPPVDEPEVIPQRMCVSSGDAGGGGGGTSTTVAATTTSSTQTTSSSSTTMTSTQASSSSTQTTSSTSTSTASLSTSSPSKSPTQEPSASPSKAATAGPTTSQWYVDWNIDKCVQLCDGNPPCGGVDQAWGAFWDTVEECCGAHLYYVAFADCHTIPSNTVTETSAPTPSPSKSPTDNPTTTSPTSNPTNAPSKSPVTSPPTQSTVVPPTTSPSKPPTIAPSSSPGIPPTTGPTSKPTKAPSGSPATSPPTQPPPTPPVSSSDVWYIDWDKSK